MALLDLCFSGLVSCLNVVRITQNFFIELVLTSENRSFLYIYYRRICTLCSLHLINWYLDRLLVNKSTVSMSGNNRLIFCECASVTYENCIQQEAPIVLLYLLAKLLNLFNFYWIVCHRHSTLFVKIVTVQLRVLVLCIHFNYPSLINTETA